MAFQNIGFETGDAGLGDALGWTYTFLAQAQLLADIDPVDDRPQEDFERDWGLDAKQVTNWDITGSLDGTYEIIVNSSTATVNAVGLTATQIRDQLLVLMQAFVEPVAFASGGGDDIDGTADTAGEGFNVKTRQFINFDITGGTDGDYIINIDGAEHKVVAVSLTPTQIRDQLLALLLAGGFDIAFQAGAVGDSIDALADVPGESFTYSSSSTGSPITEVVGITETTPQPNTFFILDFVESQLTEALYDAVDVPPGELGGEDFEEGWDTNQGYLFQLINTFVASYDFKIEPVEDFEDEWSNRQHEIVTWTITGGADGTYEIIINGTVFQFIASSNTATEIRDDLLSQLQAASIAHGVDFVGGTSDDITGTSIDSGVPFTHSTTTTGDPISTVVDQANLTYIFDFNDLPPFLPAQLVAAPYDSGTPENVEDFEEEWDSNENYLSEYPLISPPLTAAVYDTEGSSEPVEDFEEAIADRVFTIDVGNDHLVATSHGLSTNEKITLRSEGLLPTDLSPNLTYYASIMHANAFHVSKESGGVDETLTETGFGPHFFKVNPLEFWTLFMETI